MTRSILTLCVLFVLAACNDGGDTKDDPIPGETDTGSLTPTDNDGDGAVADEDCDDSDPTVYVGANELCDGVDNDCDGDVDEDATDASTWYADTDGDGFGDDGTAVQACEQPEGYVPDGGDCDDTAKYTFPEAPEQCDGVDNDCDGDIDEDVLSTWYADTDGDGYGDADAVNESCNPGSGYVADSTDCDDADATSYPGGAEVCDEADNNCDGTVDEGVTSTFYEDSDGDTFGRNDRTVEACSAPSGYSDLSGDCDDGEYAVNPDATEICNGIDDDCDRATDDADSDVDTSTGSTWYADTDGDTYGDASSSVDACDRPSGYVTDSTDCDDSDSGINTAATEVCNGVDDDCDGATDDADSGVDTSTQSTWYADADSDSYGDASRYTRTCSRPSGYTSNDTDCDDSDSAVNPAATEICNEIDDDCDGDVDDDDSSISASSQSTWYADGDTDGYGDAGSSVDACDQPSGYTSDDTDCDDGDSAVNPGAEEVCDEADNDCDGSVDNDAVDGADYATDNDSDGFGEPGTTAWGCEGADNELDCNDSDASEPVVVDASTGSSSGSGTLISPYASIQDGIDNASECVAVYSGTYNEAIDFSGKDIAVVGVDGPNLTTISATGTGEPAVTFETSETADAILRGFTLEGDGHLDASSSSTSCGSGDTCTDYYDVYCGGAVYIDGASPTLQGITVHNVSLPPVSTSTIGNDTYYVNSYGGGVCVLGGSPQIEGSRFERNYADQGGAIYLDTDSSVNLERSWLVSNLAADGAGIEVDGGSLSMTNIASLVNVADGDGGGVLVIDGTLTVTNVTMAGDDALYGGGIYASGSSSATVLNAIISDAANGEGVLVDSGASYSGTYSNVYNNAGGNYSGVTDPTGSNGNISSDPDYTAFSDDGNTGNDDLTLSSTSPSINTGIPASAYRDADNTRSDMGAFGGPNSNWAD